MNRVGEYTINELTQIISPLAYYNRFQTPLTADEVFIHSNSNTKLIQVKERLDYLCSINVLKQDSGFYFIAQYFNPEWIHRKMKGAKEAEKALKIAHKFSNLIRHFPFVRGIYLSGSLSKNYFDSQSDIDYFIITEPGRLWICRSLLIAFKKIFLLNSKKYFCVNYFIDTKNLAVPDHNLFVATEIAHLIPAYNVTLLKSFLEINQWTKEYLPNFINKNKPLISKESSSILQRCYEYIFKGKIGELIDDYFFKITLKKWNNKFPDFSETDFDLNLRTRKNVSKHHPRGYQKIVMDAYFQRMDEVQKLLY